MASPGNLEADLEFAIGAARRAGAIALEFFQTEVAVEKKGDNSPVTIADRRAEQELRKMIRARYPADGVIGEEFGESLGSSGRRWILDPIDGTQSFVHGVPLFGVLIGMEDQGSAALGVTYLPAMGEMVYGASDLGAWCCRPGTRSANRPGLPEYPTSLAWPRG
jgi:fructose-1,6-bisphosphatase/inositol monophosphatase family enzyme